MSFISIQFILFVPIVFLLYWFAAGSNVKLQNIVLLFASYVFYAWWDYKFLFLLFFVSFCNYLIGIRIGSNKRKKNIWLVLGLCINITTLVFFKYYNFFIESFNDLISLTGYSVPVKTLNIILPLGISFYTFIGISYIADIYKGKMRAEKNIINVLLTLSFFPIILAGPIQRPFNLLPQIKKLRIFHYSRAVDGMRQILWGFFAKIVIADNLGITVDKIFSGYHDYSGSMLFLGAVFFTIQIYADFSGYSNIAIGTAKLFDIELMRNFAYPYFSRNISDFWKRWHISLTTWFRDYVFLPVSFFLSRKIRKEKIIFIKTNLLIYILGSAVTWFLTGLWHGANYTFIVWGMFHGCFLVFYQWQRKPRKRLLKKINIKYNNILLKSVDTGLTLIVVTLTWIFFRAESLHKAIRYIDGIFSISLFSIPEIFPTKILLLVFIFTLTEWLQRDKQHALQFDKVALPKVVRWAVYYGIIILLIKFCGNQQEFIYLQF